MNKMSTLNCKFISIYNTFSFNLFKNIDIILHLIYNIKKIEY